MNKYTLKKIGEEEQIYKNDNPIPCPFIVPMFPVPAQTSQFQTGGGVTMATKNCTTQCPLVKLRSNNYTIFCGCEPISFLIEENEAKEPISILHKA